MDFTKDIKNIRQKLKEIISRPDGLEKVVARLEAFLEKDSPKFNEVLIIKGHIEKLSRAEMLGTLSPEDIDAKITRTRLSLLQFIDKLQQVDLAPEKKEEQKTDRAHKVSGRTAESISKKAPLQNQQAFDQQDTRNINVDRDEQKILFGKMIDEQTSIHIMLLEAGGGMGKTALLREFWKMSEGLMRAKVNLKGSSDSFGDVLTRLMEQLDYSRFPTFLHRCRELAIEMGTAITDPTIELASFLDDALLKCAAGQKIHRQRKLTDALLVDLKAIYQSIQRPIVLLFDTYEEANEMVKEWISELLITRMLKHAWLIGVIAGRQTPPFEEDWKRWCARHQLKNLSPEHIREFLQRIKPDQDEKLIKFITLYSKGHPLTLLQLASTYSTM